MITKEAVVALEALDPQSDEFKLAIAKVLRRVDQPYGAALFDALARLTVTEAVEAVLMRRRGDGQLEVYMTQRAPDDTAYPNEWHAPGSIFRSGEDDADVMRRLEECELKCRIKSWKQISHFRHMEARGWFSAFAFLLEVEGEPKNERGAWHVVDNLPPNTVRHHVDRIIPLAVAAYSHRD